MPEAGPSFGGFQFRSDRIRTLGKTTHARIAARSAAGRLARFFGWPEIGWLEPKGYGAGLGAVAWAR